MAAATNANPSARRNSQRVSKRKRSSAAGDDTAALDAAVAASLASSAAPVAVAVPAASAVASARRASSSNAAVKTIVIDENDDEIAMEALTLVAVFADVSPDPEAAADDAADEFWIAQLLDDVTNDMLATGDSTVRVTWLNRAETGDGDAAAVADDDGEPNAKQTKASSSSSDANRYEYAYDDALDVDTILCHVFALDCADGSMEITATSLERVRR